MIADAIGQRHPRAVSGARIVSLVPSITELLYALDLGDQVVGRTGFCVHPRAAVKAVPKLGGTKDVDLGAVAALAPTHVIVNIDENTRPTYEALCALVPQVVVTHPNAPRDNLDLYRLLGAIFAREREAEALCVDFERGYDALVAQAANLPARRVLYLIWREPWMTVSADTYIGRTLALVNWQCVALPSRARYPELSNAELRDCAADLILLSSEPYPFRDRHIAEVATLGHAPLGVHLVDGEMLSWYGNRAIAGLDYLTTLSARLRDARACAASA